MSKRSCNAHEQQVAQVDAGMCLYLAGGTNAFDNAEPLWQRF